jgi:phosphate acetyltransferase
MSEPLMVANRTFDEIAIGESASFERTITRQDIELYAAVSGDANPTHLDEAFARQTRFQGVVAHGMLTAGLISNLLGNKLPGAGTVYVGQDLRFEAPVHAGDTITVSVTAKEKEPERKLIRFDCACVNQDGRRVLSGVATVLAPTERLTAPARELPEIRLQRHDSYRRLIERTDEIPPIPCAVVHPCDEASLRGAVEAAEEGMIVPILVGPAGKVRNVAKEYELAIGSYELVDVPHSHAAAAKAVEIVRAGKAELLMKGSLHTDELMHEVVAKETGLRTARRISHVFIMDVPTYPEPLFITDAAINIFPDLETKTDIVQNAIDLHLGLGLGEPRVAILSAVETVNPKIPGTLDAAALCKMADRGQIKGGLLDGPLALDNAIDPGAARIKGIVSPVAGRAQILVVPDLEAGNMLAKNLSFMASADAAGIVLGARVPIILTSRADNVRTRMASCAVAALYAHSRRQQAPAVAAERQP